MTAPRERGASSDQRDDADTVTQLLSEARRITRWSPSDEDLVLAALEQELAVAVHHFDALDRMAREIDRSLIRAECAVETERMQFRALRPRYGVNPAEEDLPFTRRLLTLDQERRKWVIDFTAQRRALLDRVATLVVRHRQLRF